MLRHCFKLAAGFTSLLHLHTDTQSTVLVVQLYKWFCFFQFGAQVHHCTRQPLSLRSRQGRKHPVTSCISHQLLMFVLWGILPSKLVTRHAPLLGIPCCLDQHSEASSPRTLYKMQKLVQFISPVPSCSHILFFCPWTGNQFNLLLPIYAVVEFAEFIVCKCMSTNKDSPVGPCLFLFLLYCLAMCGLDG